jgi:hydroxyacylglutathione hydrolase
LPAPGHHDTHVVFHDPWTGLLFSGDTVYPGRLYVADMKAYVGTLDRLVRYADEHPVTHVMGAHVEMSRRPGKDFSLGSTRHLDEAPLPMSVDQLRRVRDAAHLARERTGVHGYPDFAVWNGPCRGDVAKQVARTLVGRLRATLSLR